MSANPTGESATRVGLGLAVSYSAMLPLAIAVNLIPVCLTSISLDLGGVEGLSKEQLGRISGLAFVGVVGGMLSAGPLADRWGCKPFAVAGNVLIAVGLWMLGTAHTYANVLLAVLLTGFGAGVLDMVLSPIVCALQPHRRTPAMNWLHAFYCLGAVATILMSSTAFSGGIGWRAVSLMLIAPPIVIAAAFLRFRIPPMIPEGAVRCSTRMLLRTPHFLLALACIFLAGSTELGMVQWMPAYAEYTLKFSRWQSGMSLLAFSLAMAAGRAIAGTYGSSFATTRLLTVSCWSTAAMFLLAAFAPWNRMAVAAGIVSGFTVACLWPCMLGLVGDRFPKGGASMFGLMGAMGNLGGAVMPWIIGQVADASSLRYGISTAAIAPMLMALAVMMFRRLPEPEAGRPD